MKSLELDDEEKLDVLMPMPMDRPDYPCGMRVSLTEKEFEKLEIDYSDAKIGDVFIMKCICKITSMSLYDNEGSGQTCRCEAQITDCEIEGLDDEEDEKPGRKSKSSPLYGGKK